MNSESLYLNLDPLTGEVVREPLKGPIIKKQRLRTPKNPMSEKQKAARARRWADPVWRAATYERSRKGVPNSGRLKGQPDGMRKKEFLAYMAQVKIKKEIILRNMAKDTKFIPDNDVANTAIEALVETVLQPAHQTARIQAAKALLEYTQKKPQAATEVTLRKAEDFLDMLAQEDYDPEATGSSQET